ncbi:hypothetical protein [Anabaena sp. CCY 9614]|uniref:hypothetical protein n=1 Tax=Anabaena sp. CCY 9614 TaxID=3103869 RepID=UPI0039C73301
MTNIVAVPHAFAQQELETIVVIGRRGCTGACMYNLLSEGLNNWIRQSIEWSMGENSLPSESHASTPEMPMTLQDFDACSASSSERTNRVATELGGSAQTLGLRVNVTYGFPGGPDIAYEQFIVVRDTSPDSPSGLGTVKPVAGSLTGCD